MTYLSTFDFSDRASLCIGLSCPRFPRRRLSSSTLLRGIIFQSAKQAFFCCITYLKFTVCYSLITSALRRQLNLSYPEVYSLSVKLPYPVFDTKGTAKYDKASKSLTITLPVRPPPAPLHPAPVSAPATPVKQQGMGEEGSAENENGESGPAKGATPAATVRKSPSAGHSRWVEKPPSSSSSSSSSAADAAAGADAGSKPPASPLSLKEEVLRQAEIALKSAQEAAAKAAQEAAKVPPPAYQKATQCVPSAPTVPANAVPTAAVEPLGQEFLASATFKGMKAGYVFKKGDRGQGYYLDSKSAPHSAAPAPTTQPTPAVFPKAETTPAAASAVPITTTTVTAVYQEIPFECRQTKQALAVIVEVPHIDKSSVAVHFQTYSVSVNFRAFVDVSNGTTNIDTVQYGSVLRLSPTDCAGGLDVAMCRFDVADHNMAVVLTKALPAYWHNSSSAAAADKAFADSSASESKSGDFSSREARGLLEMLPFEAPAGASSVSAKGSCSLSAAQKSDTSSLTKADADATLKSLRNHIQSLQFSSSDALFELD